MLCLTATSGESGEQVPNGAVRFIQHRRKLFMLAGGLPGISRANYSFTIGTGRFGTGILTEATLVRRETGCTEHPEGISEMCYWNTDTELDHDHMVRELIAHLKSNGYTGIEADITGYNQPELIYWESNRKGHIPDVVAQRNGKVTIFEIETLSDMVTDHSKSQRELFHANAKQHGKSFVLVVQQSAKADAERLLAFEDIQGEVWTVNQ